MEWVSDGRVRRADFDVVLPAPEAARRLRTALDPEGDWITHVLRDADEELRAIRAGDHPDAGGLVVAIDKEHAEKLADRLARITGERPDIVHSDAADASARIARFSAGSAPWLVSVLMVSEGVDVPRLRVGVYATTARTELFFRQVIGRFIRRTPVPKQQMSHVFLPSDPRLKKLAVEIEEERNHALVFEPKGEPLAERGERSDAAEPFKALWSSARRDEDVLQTTQPGDALQLFAEPAPPTASPALAAFTTTPRPRWRRRWSPRRRSRSASACGPSAARWSARSPAARARSTASINARVNREVGAASVNKSTDDQLERANRLLEKEVNRRRG